MYILAIDSSSLVASAAIVSEDSVIAEFTLNQKKTHSQILLPMIEELFKITGIEKKDIEAIAVAGGPGSFTGLRIGAATAKGLALALGVKIINVPTIDAMAYGLAGSEQLICPIMDARRNQVYTGIYKIQDQKLISIMENKAELIEELITKLDEINQPVVFMGDGVPVYQETIDKNMKCEHSYAPIHLSRQRAGAVGALAIQYYQQGKVEDADLFVPNYLRLSQAERERMENDKKNGTI